jgi:hypothetical protein
MVRGEVAESVIAVAEDVDPRQSRNPERAEAGQGRDGI